MDRFRAGKRLWNPEDDAYLRAHYPHEPTAPLARRLRRSLQATYTRARLLQLDKSAAYLASPAACRLRRNGDEHPGRATQFAKGHVPANKGLRRPGWSPGRMRETQFKKGQRSGIAVRLWKPIGTERISNGYLERKINNDWPLQARWRAVHLLVWEAAHGPVPPGYAVTFRDGDKTHIRLENLTLISRRDLMARNSVHNLPPSLKASIQLLGALHRQINQRTDDAQQDRRSAESPIRNPGSAEGRREADGA